MPSCKLFFFLVFLAGTPDVSLFAMEGGFLFSATRLPRCPIFFRRCFLGVTVFFRAGTTFAAFFDGAGQQGSAIISRWRFLGRRFVRRSSRLRFRSDLFRGPRRSSPHFLRLCLLRGSGRRRFSFQTFFVFVFCGKWL